MEFSYHLLTHLRFSLELSYHLLEYVPLCLSGISLSLFSCTSSFKNRISLSLLQAFLISSQNFTKAAISSFSLSLEFYYHFYGTFLSPLRNFVITFLRLCYFHLEFYYHFHGTFLSLLWNFITTFPEFCYHFYGISLSPLPNSAITLLGILLSPLRNFIITLGILLSPSLNFETTFREFHHHPFGILLSRQWNFLIT